MHFQNKLDKKLGEKSAEVIDIQFGLYNYDWHYNLMEIKDTLDAVKLLNYSYYLSNKIDYTDIIVLSWLKQKQERLVQKPRQLQMQLQKDWHISKRRREMLT